MSEQKQEKLENPAPQVEKETKGPTKSLSEADFEITEAKQAFFTAIAAEGTTPKEVLNPVFWKHVAKRLSTMAEVRVMPRDGSWYGVYLVTFCDKLQVHVQELQHHKLEEFHDMSAQLYLVEWKGPAIKFCVVRKEDNERVSENHETKAAAARWVRDNATN